MSTKFAQMTTAFVALSEGGQITKDLKQKAIAALVEAETGRKITTDDLSWVIYKDATDGWTLREGTAKEYCKNCGRLKVRCVGHKKVKAVAKEEKKAVAPQEEVTLGGEIAPEEVPQEEETEDSEGEEEEIEEEAEVAIS
jgi:hypothetical protein